MATPLSTTRFKYSTSAGIAQFDVRRRTRESSGMDGGLAGTLVPSPWQEAAAGGFQLVVVLVNRGDQEAGPGESEFPEAIRYLIERAKQPAAPKRIWKERKLPGAVGQIRHTHPEHPDWPCSAAGDTPEWPRRDAAVPGRGEGTFSARGGQAGNHAGDHP